MKLNTSNSPFTEKQVSQINNLLQTLTESQQQWLSGFLLANSNDTTSDSNQQQLETEVVATITNIRRTSNFNNVYVTK